MAATTSFLQQHPLAILSKTIQNTHIPNLRDNQQPMNMIQKSNNVTLAPGYSFRPKDTQLVGYYLYKKLTNGSFIGVEELLVNNCDLYGNEEPWQVWERFCRNSVFDEVDDLYFFTPLKKKTNNGSNFHRRVGAAGTWHGEDKGLEIKVKINGEQKHATKKRYSYRNPSSVHHCRWVMHEYSLPEISTSWVLCRLRKNDPVPAVENKKRRKVCDSSSQFAETSCSKRPAIHHTPQQEFVLRVDNGDQIQQEDFVLSADNGGAIDQIPLPEFVLSPKDGEAIDKSPQQEFVFTPMKQIPLENCGWSLNNGEAIDHSPEFVLIPNNEEASDQVPQQEFVLNPNNEEAIHRIPQQELALNPNNGEAIAATDDLSSCMDFMFADDWGCSMDFMSAITGDDVWAEWLYEIH